MNKKARNGSGIWIILLLVGAILVYFFFIKSTPTSSEMTRTAPSTTAPNSVFTVSYSVSRQADRWGATVVENIAGGCTINGKTALQFVMLSDLPNPLTYTVQAPSSGSCTFTGDYQFGNENIIKFPDKIVQVQ